MRATMNAPNLTLVEIEHSITEMLAAYDDTLEGLDGGEREDFVADFDCLIDKLGEQEAGKVDAYGFILSKLDAESARLKGIEGALYARRKAVDNRAQSIKDHVLNVMDFTGRKKIEGGTFIARVNHGSSLSIDAQEKIPPEYLITTTTVSTASAAIKATLKNGEAVPGASLKTSTSVSVKAR